MSEKPNEATLDSWATLRLAAAQVEEEDQLEGSMGMLQAADEVAALLNLPSPLRGKKPLQSADRLGTTNDSNAFDRTTHSLSLSESQIQTVLVNNDADFLLRDMKISPRVSAPAPSHSVAFEDVDALLRMGGLAPASETQSNNNENSKNSNSNYHSDDDYNTMNNSTTNSRTNNRNSRSGKGQEHYLQRLRSNNTHNNGRNSTTSQFNSVGRSAASVRSTPCALSLKLQQLSPERVQRLCENDLQRQLLQHMVQVQLKNAKNSHRSSSHRGSLSARSDNTNNSSVYTNHNCSTGNNHRENWERERRHTEALAHPRNIHHVHTADHYNKRAHKYKGDKSEVFLLYEEAKECVFEPNYQQRQREKRQKEKHYHHNHSDDDSDDEAKRKQGKDAAFFMFLSRQEGEERKRREEVKFLQQQLDYDAKLNKKKCPSCGAIQSYDEVREKRKNCPGCNVPYVSSLCWSTVARQFLKRAKDHQQKKQANLHALAQEIVGIERGELVLLPINATNNSSTTNDNTSNSSTNNSNQQKNKYMVKERNKLVCDVELFLQRLAEASDRRTQRLALIEQEAYKNTTFQPNMKRVSDKNSKSKNDDFAEDEDDELVSVLSADPVRDFLLRYEEDMEDRKRRMPQKYRAKDSLANGNSNNEGEYNKQRAQSPIQRFRF